MLNNSFSDKEREVRGLLKVGWLLKWKMVVLENTSSLKLFENLSEVSFRALERFHCINFFFVLSYVSICPE